MRKLTPNEIELIKRLLSEDKVSLEAFTAEAYSYCVEEMKDGGMGSLLFTCDSNTKRRLGKVLAEGEFIDADGVTVLVTLNLDSQGNFFELDIWKTDFSPVINLIPSG